MKRHIYLFIALVALRFNTQASLRYQPFSGAPCSRIDCKRASSDFYAHSSGNSDSNELQKLGDEIRVLKQELEVLQDHIVFADQRVVDFLKNLSNSEKNKKEILRLLEFAIEQKKHCSERYQELNKKLFVAQRKEFNLQSKQIQAKARVKYLPPLK